MTDKIHKRFDRAPKRRGSENRKATRRFQPKVAEGSASRAAAALCVDAVEEGKSLSEVLLIHTKDLDIRDRAFVSEIVYGTLRHRRLLSLTASKLMEHTINQRFNKARTLILCGIYQLIFTRAPAHAIVASTVGACELLHVKQFTGMVNAVLRRFLREGGHLLHSADPAVEHSFPKWLYEMLEKSYGPEKTLEIMKNSNEHAPMFLRVENSKISTDEYLKLLQKEGIMARKVEHSDCTLLLEEPVGVESLPLFYEGLVSVQDLAAQLAAPLLNLDAEYDVLDTCCAPGGKSAHILDICPQSRLTACDISQSRLEAARSGLARLKRSADLRVLDASESLAGLDKSFDRILVDAPCSGTGVIRRHPDIKWLRRQKDIENLVATQAAILDNAFSVLNKGGILVYTTCSILDAENIEQVRSFLQRHADAQLLPFIMNGQTVETWQRLPGEDSADGFFYARFKKV